MKIVGESTLAEIAHLLGWTRRGKARKPETIELMNRINAALPGATFFTDYDGLPRRFSAHYSYLIRTGLSRMKLRFRRLKDDRFVIIVTEKPNPKWKGEDVEPASENLEKTDARAAKAAAPRRQTSTGAGPVS